ncbi:Negative regulator of flagellin synthesis [Novosphingobium lubricantis]|jgi:negative regulator of flagellin synthesis FlgM
MSPFEIGAMRPTGPVQGSNARTASAASAAPRTRTTETPDADAGAAAQVERSAALDAGQSAPVDAERVKVIREAIEKGAYPVIPTRIADAMIAAGMLLRTAAQ